MGSGCLREVAPHFLSCRAGDFSKFEIEPPSAERHPNIRSLRLAEDSARHMDIPSYQTPRQSLALTDRNGRPGWNRTSNPQLRRLMLYPLELRAHTSERTVIATLSAPSLSQIRWPPCLVPVNASCQRGTLTDILKVCSIQFCASEERSFRCRSAHSNPTVVAAQRRTDFVLA